MSIQLQLSDEGYIDDLLFSWHISKSDKDSLFQFIRETTADNAARFFTPGIGDMVSHSLLEGAARAGKGFYQSVLESEELDRKSVGILKGALTLHIYDYTLEVEYEPKDIKPCSSHVSSVKRVKNPVGYFISVLPYVFLSVLSTCSGYCGLFCNHVVGSHR